MKNDLIKTQIDVLSIALRFRYSRSNNYKEAEFLLGILLKLDICIDSFGVYKIGDIRLNELSKELEVFTDSGWVKWRRQ